MKKDSIIITTEALNSIKLDELVQVDRANGSSNQADLKAASEVDDKLTGLNVPFISINGYNVTNFLTRFNLNLGGFMPVINFSFIAAENVFISANYPKDGDLVSLYMRSPGDYYKPIRMDFSILTVSSEPSSRYSPSGTDSEGMGINLRFNIVGECKIPGIYTQRIKSFKNQSSHDTLLDVAQELNLGFSSNEKTVNDKMTWICPNYSYYDFIQEVSLRSYKDDESSFFDCWIDPYYNLNFVNLGTQFAFEGDPEWQAVIVPGYTAAGMKMDSAIPGASAPSPTSLPLVLTNFAGFGVVPYFINGYTLTSRTGNNTNETGYIVDIGFYNESTVENDPSDKYVSYPIESQTTENVGIGTILQKGRARSNDYKDERRREWLGVLNSNVSSEDGNGVHENYLHAKYQNIINVKDSTKMTLEVELMDFFPGIYRGQVIPVGIYVSSPSGLRQQNVGNKSNRDANTSLSPTKDEFLSGNYVVMSMSVYWSYGSPGMRQQLTLAKRNWRANSSGAIPKAFPISVTKGLF
jgi:hypothetical protein